MKFTKRNLRVADLSIFDGEGRRIEPHFDIIISTESRKETTKIRDEILSNQERAEKYDKLSNSEKYNVCNDDKSSYCTFEKQVDELQQENKRLKADIEKREKVANILQHDLSHLREKINKIQELADDTDLLVTKRQLEEVLKGEEQK